MSASELASFVAAVIDDGINFINNADKAVSEFGNLADDVTMPVSVSTTTTTSDSISFIEEDDADILDDIDNEDDDDDADDFVRGKLFCFPDGTDIIDLVIGPAPDTGHTTPQNKIEIVLDHTTGVPLRRDKRTDPTFMPLHQDKTNKNTNAMTIE